MMDTAFEAIMRDMLNNGWFTASAGDVESPTGYFGYVVNTGPELIGIRDACADTISAYGDVPDSELIGAFFASINSDGIIRIDRVGDIPADCLSSQSLATPAGIAARKRFDETEAEWAEWEGN